MNSYRNFFEDGVSYRPSVSRIVSPSNRGKQGSPNASFRLEASQNQFMNDMQPFIQGLEARIEDLEQRYADISNQFQVNLSDLELTRKKLNDVTVERDHLSQQLVNLKAIISSESDPVIILEKANSSDADSHLGFKLEIYKQQISFLHQEIEKLKNRR